MSELQLRIEKVKARVRQACEKAGRSPESVDILAISKFQPSERIREVGALGFDTFGENYVQEGSAKALELPHLRFVLTGPLQRNKAKAALTHFQEIMSVDRLELLTRLARLAEELDVTRGIWIQVDLWDEATKVGGCSAADLPPLMDALKNETRLDLKGLMAIPPPHCLAAFQDVSRLRDELQQRYGKDIRLSMGMSEDMEAAIAAGSDQVRIGTAIFGSR